MSTGKLIAIEGIDGAGKGTQAARLAEVLRAAGHEVVMTREPTAGPHGQKIRELSTAGAQLSAAEQLDYFIADRAEHVRDLIAPALERGAVVITDRYFLSNVAYQGAAGLDPEEILAKNEAQFPLPDAAIVISLSPEEALRRVRARGDRMNETFEREDFLVRVAAIYETIERSYVHRVDGESSPEAVHARVRDIVSAQGLEA